MKIMLDAGHSENGSPDPGAANNGLVEAALTRRIVDVVKKQLAGYEAEVLEASRGTLSDRTSEANRAKADFFLSIHCNAGGGTGFESYVHTNAGQATKQIREKLHNTISGMFFHEHNVTDRGMKYANFEVLRNTNMPAALLECLFVDNPTDVKLLKDTDFLQGLGNEIAFGLVMALGLQQKKNCETCKEISKLTDENRRLRQTLKQVAGLSAKYVAEWKGMVLCAPDLVY